MHIKPFSYHEHYFVNVMMENALTNGRLITQELKKTMTIKYSKKTLTQLDLF